MQGPNLLAKCAESVLRLTLILGQILQRLFALPLNRDPDRFISRCEFDLEGLWSPIRSAPACNQYSTLFKNQIEILRIGEDVNRHFPSLFIPGGLNPIRPH